MADAVAQRHQQLKNEANKMALKIPFFHGDKKDDTIQIKEMIRRFENSADAMGLNDQAEKCLMFSNYLRGPAAALWDTMKFWNVDKTVWLTVKNFFLEQYQGAIDTDTFTFKITKLHQGPQEAAINFGTRCIQSVCEQFESMPAPPAEELNAAGAAVPAAAKENIHQISMKRASDLLARAFFVTGVREHIRTNLQNKAPATITEAITEAIKLEKVYHQKDEYKSKVSSMADMEDEELNEIEDMDDATVSQINKARAHQGRQPYRRFNNFRKPARGGQGVRAGQERGNGNGYNPDWKCRYCDKTGHMQLECRSRIRANAPLKNKAGKVIPNSQGKVREVEVEKDDTGDVGFLKHVLQSGNGCGSLRSDSNTEKPDHLNF